MSIETQKMNLRTSIKALESKQSRLACEIAHDLGITGYFFHDQLDMNSKRVNPVTRRKYEIISSKLEVAVDELEKRDYPSERYTARKLCYEFINGLPIDIVISVLRQLGCLSTTELVEKLIHNPDLLDEVVL